MYYVQTPGIQDIPGKFKYFPIDLKFFFKFNSISNSYQLFIALK